MKMALLSIERRLPQDTRAPQRTLMAVKGPDNPDRPGTPITKDTAFPAAPGFEWRHCGDEVTLASHIYDDASGTFVVKPQAR